MVVGQGLILAVAGVGVGLIGAVLLTRFLESLLFNITTSDPATFAIIVPALLAIAVLASYLPARKAMTVDPTEALRYE